MKLILITIFAVALPLALANYNNDAPSYDSAPSSYSSGDSSSSDYASGASSSSGAPDSDVVPSFPDAATQSDLARYGKLEAQLRALNNNANAANIINSQKINDIISEQALAAKIRNSNAEFVAPNHLTQSTFRSLLVPNGRNTQVIATNALPTIVVDQPETPVVTVSSGPAAIVRTGPVIYKLKAPVIYQQELHTKVPPQVNLSPVFVKVSKVGESIKTPVQPIVHAKYAPSTYDYPAAYPASYSSPSYSASYPDSYPNTYTGPSYDAPAPVYSQSGDAYAPAATLY